MVLLSSLNVVILVIIFYFLLLSLSIIILLFQLIVLRTFPGLKVDKALPHTFSKVSTIAYFLIKRH
jgi:hypothetical protein